MPHSTAYGPCSPAGRTSVAGRRAGRAACGGGPGRPCAGWCSVSRAAAGRRGSSGGPTPYRHAGDRAGCAAYPARDAGREPCPGRLELRRIAPLPGHDHAGHGFLAPYNRYAAWWSGRPRAPQPVVARLDGDATGRLRRWQRSGIRRSFYHLLTASAIWWAAWAGVRCVVSMTSASACSHVRAASA